VWKPLGKRLLGRPRSRREGKIKGNFRKLDGGMNRTDVVQGRNR
jgi:hypothetical protein